MRCPSRSSAGGGHASRRRAGRAARPPGSCGGRRRRAPPPPADELAPAHVGVDGDADQLAVPLRAGLGQRHRLLPHEHCHGGLGDLRWPDSVARVGEQAVLLDRRLQYASQRPAVAVDGRGRQALGQLVVEPGLDRPRPTGGRAHRTDAGQQDSERANEKNVSTHTASGTSRRVGRSTGRGPCRPRPHARTARRQLTRPTPGRAAAEGGDAALRTSPPARVASLQQST